MNRVIRPSDFQGALHQLAIGAPNKIEESCDLRLWHDFQEGSEIAYEAIYRNYAEALYAFGLKLTKDKELVKDCIQDLFVEIWKSKHRLASVKSIKSYLFKSIRRKVIADLVKKRKTCIDNILTNIPRHLQNCSVEASWIENQNFAQQQRNLKKALSMLSESFRN